MVAMYVALPAFVLVVAWFVPLQEGVAAALLGFAVAPVLPPWAKKAAAAGGQADYVIGLQVLSMRRRPSGRSAHDLDRLPSVRSGDRLGAPGR